VSYELGSRVLQNYRNRLVVLHNFGLFLGVISGAILVCVFANLSILLTISVVEMPSVLFTILLLNIRN